MIGSIRIYLIAAAVAVILSGALWYRHALIAQGKAQCEANMQRLIQQQQVIANENSAVYAHAEQKAQIIYRTRIKEVVKEVPVNHACDVAPSVVDKLNSAIRGDAK